MIALFLACRLRFSPLFLFKTVVGLGSGAAHTGLGLSISINNQYSLPQTCPQANLMWTWSN